MLRRALLLPALAGLVSCQTTTSYDINPTPDALPLDDLVDVAVPTYTETPGLDSDIVYYASATAISAAAADATESPLSVFPAATEVPINSAGDDSDSSDSANKKRAACAPQATIANYYSVDVGSYSAFKADPTISSVAVSAPTPSGYFQTMKNLPGANSAYAYLGYAVVNKGQSGYDTNWCANKCTSISGCLSFNIYFERDPVIEPGTGCTNPAAFANVKCSFWGAPLDSTTAKNTGQWRSQFQVAIAGSNSYTTRKIGGPVDGYTGPTALNNATMNAPLRDCSNTWTYLGYKLYQSGPYDPALCGAACTAQTQYNLAHPPSSGASPVQCAAFGSYLLTMTNSTGAYPLGQMCTMYTSNWDKQYAVNTASYNDAIGAKYTYSYSFFYYNDDNQPVCSSSGSTVGRRFDA